MTHSDTPAKIEVRDLHKSFGSKHVLRGVDLNPAERGIAGRDRRLGNGQVGPDQDTSSA